MITRRENLLKVFRHEIPEWIPIVGWVDAYNQPNRKGMDKGLADALKKMLKDALQGGWTLNATNAMIASDRRSSLTVGWNQAVGPDLFRQYVEADFEKIENEFADFCTKIVQNVKLKPISIEQDYTQQTEKTAN